MSEHDEIRRLLALASAGALSAAEEGRVTRHLQSCSTCSGELESWQLIGRELRRQPTPQAPANLVQRTRALAEARLAEESEQRWQRSVLMFVVAFAWLLTIVSWPLFHLVTGGLLGLMDSRLSHSWVSFAGFTTLVWVAGGFAAVALSVRQRRERRMA
ncbi:MAG TPA: zf-HC2 domain-containing protein [Candidatus Limnocylindrales bacterium]|nr:zf-HC2 domain-containing protein [Candidatus Limnocylindrales bacterium]